MTQEAEVDILGCLYKNMQDPGPRQVIFFGSTTLMAGIFYARLGNL
jgi:hypothetical protein